MVFGHEQQYLSVAKEAIYLAMAADFFLYRSSQALNADIVHKLRTRRSRPAGR
jgi:hypothetical protein